MEKLSNAERFLNAYSSIEHEMERILNIKEHRRFFELVDKSARLNPVIDQYRFDLKEYSELRNAIVHDRINGEIIAIPTDAAVESIERIAALLLQPPTVAPIFLKEVLVLQASDPVEKAVRELSRHSYTQVPVIKEGRMLGLLTSNMIVKWMGSSIDDDSFSLDRVSLLEVIKAAGHEKNYHIVSVQHSLLEIPDLFYKWQQQGKKLEAVLISETGDAGEKFLGIITNRDLPAIYKEIGNNSEK